MKFIPYSTGDAIINLDHVKMMYIRTSHELGYEGKCWVVASMMEDRSETIYSGSRKECMEFLKNICNNYV